MAKWKRAKELKKRLAKRAGRRMPQREDLLAQFDAIVTSAPPPVPSYPGGCDVSLARPDLIKFDYAQFLQSREPGSAKQEQLEADYKAGKLNFLPDVEHWAMEKFFWHGLPGDSWHPLEAFLRERGQQYSTAAREQLRRWKEADLDVFEVGRLSDCTVELRAWDLLGAQPTGRWFRAIDLGMRGVNLYRGKQGCLALLWLAPWAPDEDLFCATGYGMVVDKEYAAELWMPRLTADAKLACSRWPWQLHPRAGREHRARWKQRSWQEWIASRVELPFDAMLRGVSVCEFAQIDSMVEADERTARENGIYFGIRRGGERLMAGATGIWPLDLAGRNSATLAEYRAWRDHAGPPPRAHQCQPPHA